MLLSATVHGNSATVHGNGYERQRRYCGFAVAVVQVYGTASRSWLSGSRQWLLLANKRFFSGFLSVGLNEVSKECKRWINKDTGRPQVWGLWVALLKCLTAWHLIHQIK
ncbi:hypothetical protein L1987_49764 [Smallanthus sonchifolius]|uniref:Uncharacterized protein n=1 Tax=Smallanthus sonchifolius TaxID=185202 RepID=A0ACB9FWH0_9ASTR|nr:hypothetical protein L1987_49764 [Smallanthus sonchifolius]